MRRPKRYRHIVAAVYETPWAILPSKLDTIVELLELRAAGRRFTGAEIAARIGDLPNQRINESTNQQSSGHVALLSLAGTIFHKADAFTQFSGGTSAVQFGRAFDAAMSDDAVESILIAVDSPGGAVPGIQEVSDKVFAARGRKRVWALVDPMAASAAYWIASQAEALIATPSAVNIGSIGVLTVHTDRSAANAEDGIKRTYIQSVEKKAQFNPDEPLSADDLAEAQARVSAIHATFVAHVARGRGIPASSVDRQFGAGRTFLAAEALERGMIDRIATFDDVLADLGADPLALVDDTPDRFLPAFAACARSHDTGRFQKISHQLSAVSFEQDADA